MKLNLKVKLKREESERERMKNFKEFTEVIKEKAEIPEGYEIVEDYEVLGDFEFSVVFILKRDHDYFYHAVEPILEEDYEKYREEIIKRVEYALPYYADFKDKAKTILSSYDRLLEALNLDPDDYHYYALLYYLLRDTILFGPITPLMKDRLLEDISCNGYGKPIYVYHRNYQNLRTNVVFSEDELDSFIIKLAQQCGKHISIAEPMLDATLPDGSRIQMTLGREVTDHGSTFTIRKFRDVPLTPIDLIAWKTFSLEEMAYLWLCIENKKNLIFAGGTASGKTTSMNAISLFIPKNAKIVSIEDTREVMLPHENWIPAVTREGVGGKEIDMYELLRAALRQRPEYIIVGEVRGKEALTLFQAMSTGHTTYSTLHADSVNGVIHRLENPPINVPRSMIEALDIISIQAQVYLGNKRVRRNLEIAEIVGMDPHTKIIKTTTVFAWDSEKDEHLMIGSSKVLEEIRKMRAWSRKELEEELETRKKVLKWMLDNNIRDYKEVAKIIHSYQSDKDRLLEMIS
ncbi:type II secretion system protein E [Ferroglobus placidus DSM 10642]|uniref:Type II secretion system protein E n=1 Tax=Ferroglobus placidus (strain DSM 10642 / AEDII12DO) TaxID=589924 RepID=D3RWT9_FERPA|nr:type II/IV secretion system ATPase subunit [Ferroglobus placidus]ADC64952.1 type II secretion system protein E [Ferroglobus placidus DSM 10642]